MAHRDLLTSWLKDAHGMEEALIPVMENHAKDAEGRPEIADRIRKHVDETRRHAELVEGCLDRLGEKPSTAKSWLGKAMGSFQAPSTGPFQDEQVKNAISDHAVEHFEMACYRALAHTARRAGEEEIATTCEEIMREEEAMARWLDEKLPNVVDEVAAERVA